MYPRAKRSFDLAVACALVVLVSPLIVLLILAVGLDALVVPADRGGIFHSESRISRGRTFRLLKFRSARPDGSLTWAGRTFLRRWYLDELPQLANVLAGQMSLVGPRPWPPQLVERQRAEGLDYRERIVAGLTGPAQATKGVAGTRYAELDLEYVRVCETVPGLQLVRYDLRILRRTLGVLARGEGLNF